MAASLITQDEWDEWARQRQQRPRLAATLEANAPDFSVPPPPEPTPLRPWVTPDDQPTPVTLPSGPAGRTILPPPDANPVAGGFQGSPPEPLTRPAAGPPATVNQFADQTLSFSDAAAACGPAAAVAFYQATGRNMTVGEATQIARENGLWDPQSGMHGPQAQQQLLSKMGVPSRLEGSVNWDAVQQNVAGGNPVIIDSPGHYWQVAGYNPDDGRYLVGESGAAFRGGSQWMTPQEMTARSGAPRSALYLDNPQTPTPGVAVTEPRGGDLQAYARGAATRAGIDPDLYTRQIQQESGFNPAAKSPAGAQGIAQIVPQFHPGVDPSDPYASLDYAASLMGSYVAKYGDYGTALAAYNAGPVAVARYGGVPPFEETHRYIDRILGGQPAPVTTPPITPGPGAPNLAALTQAAIDQTAALPPYQPPPRPFPRYTPPEPKPPAPVLPDPALGAASYDQPTSVLGPPEGFQPPAGPAPFTFSDRLNELNAPPLPAIQGPPAPPSGAPFAPSGAPPAFPQAADFAPPAPFMAPSPAPPLFDPSSRLAELNPPPPPSSPMPTEEERLQRNLGPAGQAVGSFFSGLGTAAQQYGPDVLGAAANTIPLVAGTRIAQAAVPPFVSRFAPQLEQPLTQPLETAAPAIQAAISSPAGQAAGNVLGMVGQVTRDVAPPSIVTRTLAGEEQIAAESAAAWQALQAAINTYGPDSPQAAAAAEDYNQQTAALRAEGVYNVAERNPSLFPAELASNLSFGAVSALGAPSLASHPILGNLADPYGVGDIARLPGQLARGAGWLAQGAPGGREALEGAARGALEAARGPAGQRFAQGAAAGAIGTELGANAAGEEVDPGTLLRNAALTGGAAALLGRGARPELRPGEGLLGSLGGRAPRPPDEVPYQYPRRSIREGGLARGDMGYQPGTPEHGTEAALVAAARRARDGVAHVSADEMARLPGGVAPLPAEERINAAGNIVADIAGRARSLDDLRMLGDLGREQGRWYTDISRGFTGLLGREGLPEASTMFGITSQQTPPELNTAYTLGIRRIMRNLVRDGELGWDTPDETAIDRIWQGVQDARLPHTNDRGQPIVDAEGRPTWEKWKVNRDQVVKFWNGYRYGQSEVKANAKTASYAGSVRDAIDLAYDPNSTNDVWVARLFGYRDTNYVANSDPAYRHQQAVIDYLAREQGILPREMQAAMWIPFRAIYTDPRATELNRALDGGAISLGEYLRRAQAQHIWPPQQPLTGDWASIMRHPAVQWEIAQMPQTAGAPAPFLGAESRQVFGGKNIARLPDSVRAITPETRAAAVSAARATAPVVEIPDTTLAELQGAGYNPATNRFDWLEQPHDVIPTPYGTVEVHLPGGNADLGEFVAAGAGQGMDLTHVEVDVPDIYSGSVGGFALTQRSGEPFPPEVVDAVKRALGSYGLRGISPLDNSVLRVPFRGQPAAEVRDNIRRVTAELGLTGLRGVTYRGGTIHVPSAEFGTTYRGGLDLYGARPGGPSGVPLGSGGNAGPAGPAPSPGGGGPRRTPAFGAASGLAASQTDTNEDTSPQERTARGAAGLTAGLLGARLSGAGRPFFSQLQRTLEEKLPATVRRAQLLGLLKGSAVKADELKWSGLDDFLSTAGDRPIGKGELLDYLRQHEVQVEEVLHGPPTEAALARGDALDAKIRSGQPLTEAERAEWEGLMAQESSGTQYQPYQLPGGQHYRELLLTLPSDPNAGPAALPPGYSLTKDERRGGNWWVLDHPGGKTSSIYAEDKAEAMSEAAIRLDLPERVGEYRSPHWEEPNVLAHVRFNDRTDANGKKTLLVEEIQSDWHQTGRREGYRSELEQSPLVAQRTPDGYWEVKTEGGRFVTNVYDAGVQTAEEAAQLARERVFSQPGRTAASTAVPDAPFQKTWHELALKRMVQWAAEHGYDQLAWTTGAQQAARYGGDRQDRTAGMAGFYDKILPEYAKKLAKQWGAEVGATEVSTAPRLGQAATADLRVVRNEDDGLWQVIDVHDRQGPPVFETDSLAEIRAYLKEQSQATETVHRMTIPEEMRKRVLAEGQPLFQAVPGLEGAAASQVGTDEDTPPEERAGRAALGFGAAGLAGRFRRGGPPREGMPTHNLPLPGELGARPEPPPMTVPQLVSWARYNGMLSGPAGRLKDVISSGLGQAGYPLERAAAVPFDIAQTKLLGGERSIYGRQVPAEVSGLLGALGEGWRAAVHTLATGEAPSQVRPDLAAASSEPRSVQIGSRTLQIPQGVRVAGSLPMRMVNANDAFFGTLASQAAAASIATREAIKEGFTGAELTARAQELADHPTLAMVKEAQNVRQYRVWQEDGKLNRALGGLRDLPGGQLVLPFVQTPVNLAKYVAERSPLGLAMLVGEHAGARMGATTTPTREHTAEMLGRVAVGSTIGFGLYQLASNGEVAGPAPTDPSERDAWARQGKQPYSVKIGDAWHDYRAWPLGPLLAAATTTADKVKSGDVASGSALATTTALALSRALLDQSFVSSLSNFSAALENPERRLQSFLDSTATSFVPSALQSLARATDPYQRRPEGNPLEQLGGSLAAAVPGLGRLVPPRVGAFGEPRARPDLQQGPLGILNPFRSSEATQDPVERELARLAAAGYKVEPTLVGGSIQLGQAPGATADVPLEPAEQDQYQTQAGRLAYGQLQLAMGDPAWAGQSDKDKERYIQTVLRGARNAAREQMKPSITPRGIEQYQREDAQRKAREGK